ncbi:MAG TPA: adenylate/guanylate cyclase domain-containing protein [Candidatus Saccharimonadales bacterium]|nr:adenylate/guanylate cyclase domain-containing protein [Candidatus Saccharimonadales bacterium]
MCPTCGAAASPNQKFCAECGSRLQQACPSCATPYEGNPKFCPECGFGLQAASASGTPVTNAAPPVTLAGGQQSSQFGTPPEVVAASTVSERKLVSVLFADLVGFTAMSETRDAEAVREQLTKYFDVAQEIVNRYGGSVEKFIGDAVMAVWGTPVAHEDDAERAVRAALELVDAVGHLGDEGEKLLARAGVLTGEAAVTLGASNQGMVAGDLVNTASRLQSVAPPGMVIVGESTRQSAENSIVFEPLGEQELKGKVSPVPAYRAVRVVAQRGGVGRGEQLEAPFMGRDSELRLVKDLFHAAPREKRPRLVSIIGQAGIGKSRLAWEFLKYIDGIKMRVLWHQGRSPAYGEGISFWALAEMVRSRVGLLELDDPPTTRAKLAQALETYVSDEAERRWIAPRLEQLLGMADADAGARDDLFAAWRTFFERVAGENTLVMVFEDLHWADPGQLDFIDHLLEWSRGSAIYIITLARPELLERRPNWGAGQRSFTSLALEPLSDEVIREILASLVPGLPETTVAQIVRRAEGIPLYAVETVRMLLQDGRLEQENGVYRPIGDLSTLAVPATLHALIAARLDSLDAADRSLLQYASVLGQTFTLRGLQAVAGQGDDLEGRLHSLVRRELLTVDTDPRSPERGQYGFVQALVRDVAYGTLTKRDRKVVHLAAGEHFESLQDDEIIDATAAHYLDAYRSAPEDPDAEQIRAHAAELLQRAAVRASALGSHEQAVRFLELAIEVTPEAEHQSQLLRRTGEAASMAGRYDVAETYLRRALAAARQAGHGSSEAMAIASLGRMLSTSAQPAAAIDEITTALPSLVGLEDDASIVAVWAALARAYMLHSDHKLSVEWADRALPLAERLDMVPEISDLLNTRATALGSLGRVRESVASLRGVLEMSSSYALPNAVLRARINLSSVLSVEDPKAGWRIAADGFEDAKRAGTVEMMATMGANAAESALHIGEWESAESILADLLGVDLAPSDRFVADAYHCVSEVLRGRPYEAGLARAEAFRETSAEPVVIAQLHSIRGWIALAEGRFSEAFAEASAGVAANPGIAVSDIPVAARAALWANNPAQAGEAADRLRSMGSHGRAINANLRAIDAGVAGAAGQAEEGAFAYRDAMRQWREMEAWFDLALCELDFVRFVGGESPDIMSAADEARAIFTRLGSPPFLRRLNEAVGLPGG